jgi:hypothetical protein
LTAQNGCSILVIVEARLADVTRLSSTRAAVVAGEHSLPVLPGLRDLLPGGGLARGSVVTVPDAGLLLLALAAGASAAGAWCALAGVQEAGVLAGVNLGICPERTLVAPHLGPNWPQVVSSLADGCEIVIVRPPAALPPQSLRRMEATLRRAGGVLLVAGEWPGAQLDLRVGGREWSGLGDGHGRLRACRAEVRVRGRGAAGLERTSWLWLPAEDGGVRPAQPPAPIARDLPDQPAGHSALRAVRAG